MDRALSIAMVAALVNIVLSTVFPCFLKKTKSRTIGREMKITFLVHRHVLFASSIVTALMVYFAVKLEPEVRKSIPQMLGFFR
jgi:ABC-type Co2+ transport system permease subunit